MYRLYVGWRGALDWSWRAAYDDHEGSNVKTVYVGWRCIRHATCSLLMKGSLPLVVDDEHGSKNGHGDGRTEKGEESNGKKKCVASQFGTGL